MHFKFDLRKLPIMDMARFREEIITHTAGGYRVCSLFGAPGKHKAIQLFAVLAHDQKAELKVFLGLAEDKYPAITPSSPQVHLFEREIFEQWGLVPEGHPWLKPLRFHRPYRPSRQALKKEPEIGDMNFFSAEGHEVHEVAVGPVHAGIIEPGHFRFQCHGEDVMHLEISLGYQHRGIERQVIKNPGRALYYMETVAGDTSIGHAAAYCENMESLASCHIPQRARMLRLIMLELERMANHIGDLGALAGDIGFLPTAAYCGRIRGDVLNLSALICGSRFGRSMLRPGGVNFNLDKAAVREILIKLGRIYFDVKGAVGLLWGNHSVLARFENIGILPEKDARNLGLVGPAARASGVKSDVRFNFERRAAGDYSLPLALAETGDVYARAMVRWLEIRYSLDFIKEKIAKLPAGDITAEGRHPAAKALAVSLVEGFRGEICHTLITDEQGNVTACKVVDPSFHNWMGLALAMRNQQISDFPLCNKSFNLSYCGHDL